MVVMSGSSAGVRLKKPAEIERIREAGRVIALVFDDISRMDLDCVSAFDLDSHIENIINKNGCRASFKTVTGYGYASCISVNSEVVHGIPSRKKIIRKGDVVKVDVGATRSGYFADACRTFCCGDVSPDAVKIVSVAREALGAGIAEARRGKRLGDIGCAVERDVLSRGCSVVKNYCGHGVGFASHEPPTVLHYGDAGTGMQLREGLVIAIEPIVNMGTDEVLLQSDGWTAVTADGKLSAQFEETVVITADGFEILTAL